MSEKTNIPEFTSMWEIICETQEFYNPVEFTIDKLERVSRMKVPGGWLYELLRNSNGITYSSLQFVPHSCETFSHEM